jgi:hypothetical protein
MPNPRTRWGGGASLAPKLNLAPAPPRSQRDSSGTTDGLREYVNAVEENFGADIDLAQLVKAHGRPREAGLDWYGPAEVIETIPTPITGEPSPWLISTSYVERANLSVRTHLRRFVRLTNGHSKKLENLKACVAIYMAWFNFCRVHSTLKVTPAMESALTGHVWTIEELLLGK